MVHWQSEFDSGSVLGSNPTKTLQKGIYTSRKTSLSNAIYGNSSEFSDAQGAVTPICAVLRAATGVVTVCDCPRTACDHVTALLNCR